MAAGAGAAAARAGCHPTGTAVLDPAYSAALAVIVTLAAGRAGRATLLWMAMIGAVMSRGLLLIPAGAALGLAFAGAFRRQPSRLLGALTGAVSIEVILRWPHFAFLGATALIAAGAVLPCLLHGLMLLPRRARFWIVLTTFFVGLAAAAFAVPVAVEAALSRTQVSRGITATESALQSVSNGDSAGATHELAMATADFDAADRRLGSWWTLGARVVPLEAQQRQGVVVGTQVARDVSAAAGEQATHIDFSQLHYQGGQIDLARVRALQGPLTAVDIQLTSGLHRLARVRSPWLLEPLESRLTRLDTQVAKAESSASLATEAVTAAPSLLGGEGTRHYFVALVDPSESRGLGGLIVSYGELTATAGRVVLGHFGDISSLNSELQAHGGGHVSGPASYLARYGTNPAHYMQNVTYSPDLPTVEAVLSGLYAQAGHGTIDGMLVLDPRALASLLSFTGGVQAPGLGQLTAANAAAILEKGQYATFPSASLQTVRRAALTQAMQEAFKSLSSGSLPGPRSLADTLSPDVHQGDLLFWSIHPSDQALLDRTGLAGRFPSPAGGDLLAVVSNNSAANKIDAYLQRTISDQVAYDPATGRVSSTVRISLHNEAPASGLSSEVIGSYAGSGLRPGTNRVWLLVYSPLQLTGASQGSQALTMNSVPELGVETYSAFVTVAAGATETVTLQLHGRLHTGSTYRLSLYQQPMVLADQFSAHVSTARAGWRAVGPPAWTPGPHAYPVRNFRFLKSD